MMSLIKPIDQYAKLIITIKILLGSKWDAVVNQLLYINDCIAT